MGKLFLDWSDPDAENPIKIDHVLANVMWYWCTQPPHDSNETWRQISHNQPLQLDGIQKPLGLSVFGRSLNDLPSYYADLVNGQVSLSLPGEKLEFFRQHHRGAAFPAHEQTNDLRRDIQDFCEQMRPWFASALITDPIWL
jgi:hypothetical protein